MGVQLGAHLFHGNAIGKKRYAPLELRKILVELEMNYLFNKTALPITLVVMMIVWAWLSFFSVALSSLF